MTLSAPASSLKDRLLERPQVYALVQAATQLTGMSHLRALFREFVDDRAYDSVLELGCGTGLWPVTRYRRFLRTDVNARYFPVAPPAGMEFRLADATDLSPLSGETFDLVYSFGLFHHLPDASVVASLREAALVLRPGGRLVAFDAIWPTHRFNFLGQVLRRLDRGGFVRTQEALLGLIRSTGTTVLRVRDCRWGPALEGCFVEMRPESRGGRPYPGEGASPEF